MEIFYNFLLETRLDLLLCMAGNLRHIRVLGRVKNLERFFSKLSSWEGKVVAFTRDVVEDILPPTVLIKEEW